MTDRLCYKIFLLLYICLSFHTICASRNSHLALSCLLVALLNAFPRCAARTVPHFLFIKPISLYFFQVIMQAVWENADHFSMH